ncbi:hypothetical protein [Anoxybacteroides amylolyticum]|uniref:Uncharacterized protein n=1 Tax=Anoxybacteroides amylolyticum TaxID=294699 RepID=A0A167SZI8_9BACL|nr:hypothetical protein [Anoxybacillus amylolyticus]ANB59219.1 hypothetical protein GFC30_2279 [Anoxybacillus amylolyticus]
MTFKASVNIKFDFGKKEFFERYIPTPSHAEVLRGLLKGFNGTGSKAHIVVGPYGTGKSLLGTLVSSIVSKVVEKETFNVLVEKFNQVDDEIYRELDKVRNQKRIYLPVILNGYEGTFRQAVLSAIVRTLKENKIPIVVPGIVSKILSIIDMWENDYPKTYDHFLKLLRECKKDLELWRLELLSFNEMEIEWFKTIYPSLTSGAQFVIDYEDDFISQVQYVLKELDKKNIGIFMVYDEFGRFLQNMPVEQIHQTMQDIQDLAELADHNTNNFHLMYITHKNLRHYFFRYSDEYRSEFQRIEKRYVLYHIENDRATYVRLIQNVLRELYSGKKITEDKEKEYIRYLRRFSIFPELNQVEIENLVVQGAYPLHPVSLALLPTLSSLFGQNERTLFTFLESSQVGGLLNFVSKYDSVYTASNLFDYFFPILEEIEVYEEFSDLNVYQKLIKKIPNLSEKHSNILKFITLWNIAGMQSKCPLTLEFISFAMDREESEVEAYLKELTKMKAIRFNSIRGYWELFEGSAFNIDEMIENKLQVLNLSREKRLQILEEHIVKKFYLANEYNDVKSMTRFASVHFIFSSDILNGNLSVLNHKKQADSLIYLVLLESATDRENVISILFNQKDSYNFYCVPAFEYASVNKYVEEYEIVNLLLKDSDLLKSDLDLKQELILKREEISFGIRRFVGRYSNFQEKLEWVVCGEKREIKNEYILEKLLSNVMFDIYPHTPEVRNDSFNRKFVNRVQLKAAYTVVDHIIKYHDKPSLNIAGNGPDYLIYATIFKNNQLDIRQLDNIKSESFRLLRKSLIELLEKKPSGDLSDLVNILRNPPFGIREPLIPIYIVSLLRDKWDNISFYRNDMYVAEINGENLFKMIEEAEQYIYFYYEFGNEYEELFKLLEGLFERYIDDELAAAPKHLKIAKASLRWMRSLSRFAQVSSDMEEELIQLKEKIRQIEVNPNQSLEALIKKYGNNLELLKEHVSAIESFYINKKEQVKNKVYEMMNVSSYEELVNWANEQDPVSKKQNRLVVAILDSDSENWFDLLTDRMVGVSFDTWSDNTVQMFFNQISNEYSQLANGNVNKEQNIHLIIDGDTKVISRVNLSPKSQTLYQNINRIIRNGGKTVPQEEIEYLIYQLVKEFVK